MTDPLIQKSGNSAFPVEIIFKLPKSITSRVGTMSQILSPSYLAGVHEGAKEYVEEQLKKLYGVRKVNKNYYQIKSVSAAVAKVIVNPKQIGGKPRNSKLVGEDFDFDVALNTLLNEGINDPGIFKAVFTAGGPGSGKSTVAKSLGLYVLGLRSINSDTALEHALKKAGAGLKLDKLDPEVRDNMRVRAKEVSGKQMQLAIQGRLGLVIDSTARDVKRILKQKDMLERLGYETAMLFVNTSLETALERNAMRERSVPENVVRGHHAEIQKNKRKLKSIFMRRFWEIDNDGTMSDLAQATGPWYSKVKSWTTVLPSNQMAQDWINLMNTSVHEQSIQELDLRSPAKRDISRTHENMKKFEAGLMKRMMADPKNALRDLKITIDIFKKQIRGATSLTQPIIQAQIDKFESVLTQLEKKAVTEGLFDNIQKIKVADIDKLRRSPEEASVAIDKVIDGLKKEMAKHKGSTIVDYMKMEIAQWERIRNYALSEELVLSEIKSHGPVYLECQECSKKFKVKNPTSDTKCPKCGSYDLDLDYQARRGMHESYSQKMDEAVMLPSSIDDVRMSTLYTLLTSAVTKKVQNLPSTAPVAAQMLRGLNDVGKAIKPHMKLTGREAVRVFAQAASKTFTADMAPISTLARKYKLKVTFGGNLIVDSVEELAEVNIEKFFDNWSDEDLFNELDNQHKTELPMKLVRMIRSEIERRGLKRKGNRIVKEDISWIFEANATLQKILKNPQVRVWADDPIYQSMIDALVNGDIDAWEDSYKYAQKVRGSTSVKKFMAIIKKARLGETTIDEELSLSSGDKQIIRNFIDQDPGDNKKFSTDGKQLDGLWLGGNKIAVWEKGKIHFNNLGSKSAQTVQKFIRKEAPRVDIAEAIDPTNPWKIKKALMIAKKYAGNMTKAVDEIEKLQKGLSDHKKVAEALRQYNESVAEELDDSKKPFSDDQLKVLKTEYSKLKRVDPDDPKFKKLRQYIANMDKGRLKQLADANIPWLTYLAKVALREDISVDLDEAIQIYQALYVKEDEAGTVSADTNTESIPKRVGIDPDATFGGNPVFDCDCDTFGNCIKGKKKYGRWSAFIGPKSEFYTKIQQWMSQSYKNKNFMLRNANTGEMVWARSLPENVNEEKPVTKDDPLVVLWDAGKSKDYEEQGIIGHMHLSTAANIHSFNTSKALMALEKAGNKPGKRVQVGSVWLEWSKWNKKHIREDRIAEDRAGRVAYQEVLGMQIGRFEDKIKADVQKANKTSRFKNIKNPGTHFIRINTIDVQMSDPFTPMDSHAAVSMDLYWHGSTSNEQKESFTITWEPDERGKAMIYKFLHAKHRGTYRMGINDRPHSVIPGMISRFFEIIILPKVNDSLKGFGSR